MSLVIQVLHHYPFPALASLALLLFVATFLGASGAALRKSEKEPQARAACLPLEEP